MYRALKRFLNDENGSLPIEYGLIGAALMLAFVSMLAGLGRELRHVLRQCKDGAFSGRAAPLGVAKMRSDKD